MRLGISHRMDFLKVDFSDRLDILMNTVSEKTHNIQIYSLESEDRGGGVYKSTFYYYNMYSPNSIYF